MDEKGRGRGSGMPDRNFSVIKYLAMTTSSPKSILSPQILSGRDTIQQLHWHFK